MGIPTAIQGHKRRIRVGGTFGPCPLYPGSGKGVAERLANEIGRKIRQSTE
jgi:hypothetical protein